MKVYIAAPWVHKHAALAFAQRLERAGHVITEPWWEHVEVDGYPSACSAAEHAELAAQAQKDRSGVIQADVVIVLQLAKSEGKAVEQGIALENDVPVIIVSPDGMRGHIFQYLDRFTIVASTTEAMEILDK